VNRIFGEYELPRFFARATLVPLRSYGRYRNPAARDSGSPVSFDESPANHGASGLPLPHQLSVVQAAQALRANTLTSEQLVRSCLQRISAREPFVKAWAALDAQAALAAARERDAESPRSILHGMPIAVKDVIDTSDLATEYNSPIYRGHRPAADAAVVARARAAGMIVLGKTVTQEFATRGTLGETRNPHNLEHTPGGSSSGSAAAVADFMVPLAISTQTAGSIIRPASFCGIVGFKASLDSWDATGMKCLVPEFDTLGVHVRHVADASLALEIFGCAAAPAMPDRQPQRPADRALRLRLCRTHSWEQADGATREALTLATRLLERAGVVVEQCELPDLYRQVAQAQDLITDYRVARSLAHEWDAHREQLSGELQAKIRRGLAIEYDAYREALDTVMRGRAQGAALFEDCDGLLTPSASCLAPRFDAKDTGHAAFNKIWTALGNPCIGIPLPPLAGRLPIGVQIVGEFGRDSRALWAALQVEKIFDDG
jgi:Asp-tRNA(Asn)/Glu-tRNA(Gln) amidotransferase A subunit family amidase